MTTGHENVLIVDDEEAIRKALYRRLTAEGYQCLMAGGAQEAEELLRGNAIGLVLLDINMPGKKGTELLPQIRTQYPDTAVMMVSATDDTATAMGCVREGACDYVTKPFDLGEVALSAARELERRRLKIENREYKEHLEDMVAARTAELGQALSKIKAASLDTIQRLATAAEYRDEDTGSHIKRMSQYSAAIARRLGLDDNEVENILYAAPMHDIGKIGIPDSILLKPGKLDPDEWATMKLHAVIGGRILAGSDTGFIQLAEVIALTHHEKWSGDGYPKGLSGEAIPLVGRITAVADVFDALTSERPYKKAFSLEKSFDIIRESRGSHFDPDVVDAFFAVEDKIVTIKQAYQDSDDGAPMAAAGAS